MKLVPNVYIVGAVELGMDNATNTTRNLPKPPVGDRTAEMKPPRLFPSPNPTDRAGIAGEDAANVAPRKWGIIYSLVSSIERRFRTKLVLTLALKKARYVYVNIRKLSRLTLMIADLTFAGRGHT